MVSGKPGVTILMTFLLVFAGGVAAFAQEAQQQVSASPPETVAAEVSGEVTGKGEEVEKKIINPNDIPSILFTYWEHTAIADAKRFRGETRGVSQSELTRDLETRQSDKPKPPPEKREIKLGGIVYVKADEWTIWLNNQRVTPKAIPPEVMDLKVHKEYIEMKWFDDYTNQIFPLRLRTHQKFNIDTRVFLPG